ncbi:MAG: hypothetical protein IPP74_14135 [Alphaproteobacteria bacterium]|nr:hypothetical protein [Alphaproteobacteria bacterium]
MKKMWCWRCQGVVPMLDETEYAEASHIYSMCTKNVKKFRQENRTPLAESPIDTLFKPLRDWYQQKTGMINCHQNAIIHHRISGYGEPCKSCGKPLRTPNAKLCAECGAVK